MWRDKGEIPLSVIQSVYKASKLPLSNPLTTRKHCHPAT